MTGAVSTVFAGEHGRDWPLPPFLLALTLVTGLIDAFSYLVLGHVFVANMTGNVVFLAFALAGAPGFSIAASLIALLAFVAGAAIGGRLGRALGTDRRRLLARTATVEASLFGAAALAAVASDPATEVVRDLLIVLLGLAMGMQNATARRLAVPDLTTTVLTLTITGIAADGRLGAGSDSRLGRRSLAVMAMFGGAFIGAAFVLNGAGAVILLVALGVAVTTAIVVNIRQAQLRGQ